MFCDILYSTTQQRSSFAKKQIFDRQLIIIYPSAILCYLKYVALIVDVNQPELQGYSTS